MTARITAKESFLTPTQPTDLDRRKYDYMKERAEIYTTKISEIMQSFDNKVQTKSYLKKFFHDNASVTQFSGPIQTSRRCQMNVYVNGYLINEWKSPYNVVFPKDGLYVGFIGKVGHIGEDSTKNASSALIPEHWGVITLENLQHSPYALSSRLTGRPSHNRYSAENLRLHEGLHLQLSGWEGICTELEAYLLNPKTIFHARDVIRQGIGKEIYHNL